MAPEAGPKNEAISVRSLRVGMRLTQSLYDAAGVLLLAAGAEVTPRFLELLSDRHIHTVLVQNRPSGSGLRRSLGERIGRLRGADSATTPSGPAAAADEGPKLTLEHLESTATSALDRHASASDTVAELGRTLLNGGTPSGDTVLRTVADFADMLTLDRDLLATIVALQSSRDEYLFDHCVNTSLLAMTLGAAVGLNREQLLELGTGALLHDVGMLRVPRAIRMAPRALTEQERREVERHAFYSLDYLERVHNLPDSVAMVAAQTHERNDGSGYPRRRTGRFIHPYARIAAIADSYAAMTRPRPHRPGLLPYVAAKTILVECTRRKFEPRLVRAFLDCVGLVPIGSRVELNDGTRAEVVRTNPGQHTRPMLVALDGDGRRTQDVIDLSGQADLSVVRAIATAGGAAPPEALAVEPAAAELAPASA